MELQLIQITCHQGSESESDHGGHSHGRVYHPCEGSIRRYGLCVEMECEHGDVENDHPEGAHAHFLYRSAKRQMVECGPTNWS